MKAPAFQFYPSDFIMGTAEMTAEEVGGYIRALCHQWTKEGLPNNRKKLESMLGIHGESLDAVLEKFSIDTDGRYKNARLEKVRAEQLEYRNKQAENGKKGGNPAFKKGEPNPYYKREDNPKDNPPDNPKINSSSSPSTSSIPLTTSSESSFEKEPKNNQEIKVGISDSLTEKEKPKEKSCAKKEKVKEHLFRDSPYFDLQKFIAAFDAKQYAAVDLVFYYNAVLDWSEANAKTKVDWIATCRGFMRRDSQNKILKMIKAGPAQGAGHAAQRLNTGMNVMNAFDFNEDGSLKVA